jgi:hypothetical protein
MEIFNFYRLNDVAVQEQYQVRISNSFAALENLFDNDGDVDISRPWEGIRI